MRGGMALRGAASRGMAGRGVAWRDAAWRYVALLSAVWLDEARGEAAWRGAR